MDMPVTKKSTRAPHPQKLPFDCVALVLQGGGALGAYQAGVYEALAAAGLQPDWVAGISIGAINAALIAGNAPENRVARLRGFWESVTVNPWLDWTAASEYTTPRGNTARGVFNQMSAGFALMSGAANFFRPQQPAPFLQPQGTLAATSFYDTSLLKPTLEKFIDFDRINAGGMRLSIAAVNVRTGNFAYFDNRQDKIRAEHIMASGALPPGFPAVEIDGEYYWDGGLISNTPLQWVVDGDVRQDTLAFQVDLWPQHGAMPRNIFEVETRQKEIKYSSRTRAGTDQFKRIQRVRAALAKLLDKLPQDQRQGEEYELLQEAAQRRLYNIVHLIYRSRQYESDSRDYEFSRLTMNEHWRAGLEDALKTLEHREIYQLPVNAEGLAIYDFLKQERDDAVRAEEQARLDPLSRAAGTRKA